MVNGCDDWNRRIKIRIKDRNPAKWKRVTCIFREGMVVDGSVTMGASLMDTIPMVLSCGILTPPTPSVNRYRNEARSIAGSSLLVENPMRPNIS